MAYPPNPGWLDDLVAECRYQAVPPATAAGLLRMAPARRVPGASGISIRMIARGLESWFASKRVQEIFQPDTYVAVEALEADELRQKGQEHGIDTDTMTAAEAIDEIVEGVTAIKGIARVAFDISPKPPATTEWE